MSASKVTLHTYSSVPVTLTSSISHLNPRDCTRRIYRRHHSATSCCRIRLGTRLASTRYLFLTLSEPSPCTACPHRRSSFTGASPRLNTASVATHPAAADEQVLLTRTGSRTRVRSASFGCSRRCVLLPRPFSALSRHACCWSEARRGRRGQRQRAATQSGDSFTAALLTLPLRVARAQL